MRYLIYNERCTFEQLNVSLNDSFSSNYFGNNTKQKHFRKTVPTHPNISAHNI